MGTVADPGQGVDERHELVAGEHALQMVEHLRGPAGEVVADDRREVEIRRRHVHTTPEGGSRDPTWAAPTARPTRSRVAATVEWVAAAQRREPSDTLRVRTTAQGLGGGFVRLIWPRTARST
jgi:hypothetical protein